MAWYSGLGGLADAANSAFSFGAGQLGGAISQGISGGISGAFAKKQREDAYKMWRKQMRRGPTYAVQGMRRAGLNPILALGKGGGGIGGNVGVTGQTQLDTKGVTSDITPKKQSVMDAQIAVAEAQSAQAKAAAQNQLSQSMLNQTQQGMEQWWLNAAQGLDPAAQQQLFMQKHGGPWGAGLGVLQGMENLADEHTMFPVTPKSRGLQVLLNKIFQSGHSAREYRR
ncbi:MAG TPA: hypothetical protein EYN66_02040 [Myxococcales bacterium]|nr:hypothetical protein [Myxococcales bacterium]